MLLFIFSAVHAGGWVLNNPYPASESKENIYYSSFSEQPKTLDPARSYSSNEYQFIMQIYEPLLQDDYLARPYKLVPLLASQMPEISYFDKFNKGLVNPAAGEVAFTVYTLHIKPGLLFQPHPSFAKDKNGKYRYLNLSEDYLDEQEINSIADFKYKSTREVIADDFIYQIKRMASPEVNSPIYGLMSEHIVGFREFSSNLTSAKGAGNFVDLNKVSMAGLNKIDDYTFEIKLYKQYPQFIYWLSMPFFSPIPWEADQFYAQAGMDDKNLGFEWSPVGTGPFVLSINNPNSRMVLTKNPNFRLDYFPSHGTAEDLGAGYLNHKGQVLPLIDQAIYTMEKESIPRWNKFLQGYYDASGISTDSFDQAIQIDSAGRVQLSKALEEKNMRLTQTTDAAVYYMGFNMMDELVGGASERARKLRLAISIAVNFDEEIAIFYNGRGLAAQGPIPPGIFGYKEGEAGINPYVYRWDGHSVKRRSINEAKRLLQEAGYPGGIDPKTGKALILNYDVPIKGGADDKSVLEWTRKQFAHIGIDLNIRATQYNRFQDKMNSGNAQIFSWGWNGDYPDPENFLFMFYSKNHKVKHGGENAANYENPHFDHLFDEMKNLSDGPERQFIIDQMVEILRHDAPWAWGVNTQTLVLSQQWISAIKPNAFSVNTLKYVAVDMKERNQLRRLWNQPVLWPIGLVILLGILLVLPLLYAYRKKDSQPAPRLKS